ncbi:GntR family transcriptional regulator [Persicitalea jodogahamensis]|uniref:GntR family transcriptional regulator n=2 Tax=Persicitalea jodogahamensis TaxID=402147 RepID=A0A8J3D4V6_9BACT|nr:GntR family transcriptional regulator [Persicitalea jodogahamensis]
MTDRVENILRDYFTENAFKPGDQLPNEFEMAQKLNVSRNVVREALSRLRMLGMVESRPRRGMVMAQPDLLAGLEKVLNPLLLSQDDLKDVFELRLVLELGVSEILFARKTPEDMAELEEIAERQKGLAVLTKEDEIEFHGKLYDMTGNETLHRFQSMLAPVFDHVFAAYYNKTSKSSKLEQVTHYDLFKVLKEGTAAQFRTAMYNHLAVYIDSASSR